MHQIPQMVEVDGLAVKYLSENRLRYVAQSILHGFVRDPLPDTEAEAIDIIHWHQAARKEGNNGKAL